MTSKPKLNPVQHQNKLLGLELIRFASAFAVLVWHYQHFFFVSNKLVNFERELQPFYRILQPLYEHGYYGVQVFWCISGFIFFYKYKNEIADKRISEKQFFVLRFSRLYPLHIFTLLLVAALQSVYARHGNAYFVYQNNDFAHFVLQLFLASNWWSATDFSFNGPIWSVSIEVLVYLFFFTLLRYVGKSALINIGVLLFCVAMKFVGMYAPIIGCLACFYAGGLSAIAFQSVDRTSYYKWANTLVASTLLMAPIAIYATSFYQHQYFSYVFLLAYIPLLIYIAAKISKVHPALQIILESIGNMTYSSYLVHFPLQLTIMLYFTYINQTPPYYNMYFFVGFILATFVAAYFTFHYFELPAQSYIRSKFLFRDGKESPTN